MTESGLPDQDEKRYTEADINHIVARRINQIQLDQLGNRLNQSESEHNKIFAELRTAMNNLTETVNSSAHDLYKCRNDLYA